jgi:hypothetical protein
MSQQSEQRTDSAGSQVRDAFPSTCKWFESPQVSAGSNTSGEIEQRFKRFTQNGTSPCDGCPLCQGH